MKMNKNTVPREHGVDERPIQEKSEVMSQNDTHRKMVRTEGKKKKKNAQKDIALIWFHHSDKTKQLK